MKRRASDVLCCCVTVRSTILRIISILNRTSLERWLSRVGKTVIQTSFHTQRTSRHITQMFHNSIHKIILRSVELVWRTSNSSIVDGVRKFQQKYKFATKPKCRMRKFMQRTERLLQTRKLMLQTNPVIHGRSMEAVNKKSIGLKSFFYVK